MNGSYKESNVQWDAKSAKSAGKQPGQTRPAREVAAALIVSASAAAAVAVVSDTATAARVSVVAAGSAAVSCPQPRAWRPRCWRAQNSIASAEVDGWSTWRAPDGEQRSKVGADVRLRGAVPYSLSRWWVFGLG